MSNHHSAAVLFTVNLRSIARFYEQIVEMRVHRTEDDHIVLEKDGFRLTVHQIPEEYAANIHIAVPPKIREISAIKLSFPWRASREHATSPLSWVAVYMTRIVNGSMRKQLCATDGTQTAMCFSSFNRLLADHRAESRESRYVITAPIVLEKLNAQDLHRKLSLRRRAIRSRH